MQATRKEAGGIKLFAKLHKQKGATSNYNLVNICAINDNQLWNSENKKAD